jgi:hypothetical protein
MDKAFSGVALALATEIPHLDTNKRFGVTGGYGNFAGDYSAVSVGAAARIDNNWQIGGSFGYSPNTSVAGGKIAVTGQW